MERRLAAILAADVVGYTRLMGEDEAGTLARLEGLRAEILDPLIARHRGRVVKLMGDGFLVEFASVVDALNCALAWQGAVEARADQVPEDRAFRFRIGVNLGDVMVKGDDIYGDGVNVAARLEAMADPGSVLVSRTVFDHSKGKMPATFEDLGEQELKNIAEPVRVFRVSTGSEVAETPTVAKITSRSRPVPVIAAIVALLVVAAGATLWLRPWAPDVEPASVEHMAFPLPDTPSIAVLPFDNMSGDAEQEYFADGMTDDLITDLSKISGLFVIARNSVFTYKGMPVKVQEVARELGVRYVLEGSIRRADGKVRINAQLVDATTGHHLWADRYDRDYSEIFALQDEVIGRIVAALAVQLTDAEQEQVTRAPTENLEAYEHYIQAEQRGGSIKGRDLALALYHYRQATTLDPSFPDAHAGYARVATEIWRLNNSALPADVARKQAYDSVTRALALDPDLPRAHSVLGVLHLVDRQFDQAVESARKAVSLEPGNAESYVNLALVLAYIGRPAEGSAAMELALQLDPKPPLRTLIISGVVFFMDRQYERAVNLLEDARTRFGGGWNCGCLRGVQLQLPLTYAQLGRLDDAKAETDNLLKYWRNGNLAYFRTLIAHHKRDEDLDHRLSALRKAGLPEWPLGFEGRPEDRLDGPAIEGLLFGKTWIGRSVDPPKLFVQKAAEDGQVNYTVRGRKLKGTASVEGDMLCYRFPETLMGRKLCGPVYKNPDGTPDDRNEYVAADVFDVHYFSVKQ
jgi:TolB-like protein/class 3 adenylate cyclase/cytochrome c-type biogenesis protein CcmH/NrfG